MKNDADFKSVAKYNKILYNIYMFRKVKKGKKYEIWFKYTKLRKNKKSYR